MAGFATAMVRVPTITYWLLGVVAPTVLALLYVHRFGVNVPIHDEWNFMPTVDAFYRGGDWWSLVVEHYGEHRIVLPRLVILYLSKVTHLDVKAEEYLSVSFMVAGVLICWSLLRRTGGPQWTLVPIGWLFLSIAQFENLLVGWQFQIPMMNFFVLASIHLLAGSGRWRGPWAALCAGAATFSFANGLVVWVVGLPVILTGERTARRRTLGIWATAVVAVATAYRWGYRGFDRPPQGYLLAMLHRPWEAVKMYVALAGNNFGQGTIPQMLAAGAALLLLSAVGVVLVWWLRGLRRRDVPWIALWLFSAGSIFAVTLGRSFVWQQMTTPSRFLSLAIFLPLTLIVILARAGEILWRQGNARRAVTLAVAVVLAVLAARQAWATARLGWEIGIANRELKLRARSCLLAYRTASTECLSALYVADGELVRRRAVTLDRWRLGPFAEIPRAAGGGALVAADGAAEAQLRGTLDFVGVRLLSGAEKQTVAPGDQVVAEGWAMSQDFLAPAAVIVEVDGRWVGATARFLSRPDVVHHFDRALPPCGWRIDIPLDGLARGGHRVRVLALLPGTSRPIAVQGEKTVTVGSAAAGESGGVVESGLARPPLR